MNMARITKMARCITADDLFGVMEILRDNKKVNDRFENGDTALHLASVFGRNDIVRLLIVNGAVIDSVNKCGMTPLLVAVNAGFLETVTILLQAGAEVNIRDVNGYSPLSHAVKENRDDLIRILIENDAFDAENALGNGFTALMRVTLAGEADLVEKLLDRGANINARDKNGNTALSFAVMSGRPYLVEMLLSRRAESGMEFGAGLSDLSPDKAGYFLKKIAEANRKQQVEGALIRAAEKGDKARLKRCVEDGADINYDGQGLEWTALMFAAHNGDRAMVDYLLEHGASVNARNERMGWTAISLAAHRGHMEIVWRLLEDGAEIDIFSASLGGLLSFVKVMIDKGIDVDSRDFGDRTPLCMAAMSGQLHISKYLLSHGASAVVTDKNGETVLHKAAKYGFPDLVGFFLEEGLKPDTESHTGKTPYELACENEHRQIAEILLSACENSIHQGK